MIQEDSVYTVMKEWFDNDFKYFYTDDIYLYPGHPLEIANTKKGEQGVGRLSGTVKYPAIFIFLDTPESITSLGRSISPEIAIVERTDKKYRAEDRATETIEAVLLPIYNAVIRSIVDGDTFNNSVVPEHEKVERYFYGSDLNNGKSEFPDNLDAITLSLNDLLIKKIC